MKKDNKGFSLVELIVVVLIMGILAVALTPQVLKWVNNSRVANDLQAKETAELKQGDKNFISLTGDNADISGSKVTVKGDTTINVLTSPNVTVDNLEAKSCIKAPNISDGMAVGGKDTSAGSGKLKVEEQDPNKVKEDKSKLIPKEKEEDKAYNPQISEEELVVYKENYMGGEQEKGQSQRSHFI